MAKSISAKRKPGRPATGVDRMYGARLSDEFVAKIDKWAEAQGVSRSEAMRKLIELGLKSKA